MGNQYVFARDFAGVLGVGQGHDDTDGINEALEWCYQNNRVLHLGEGVFSVREAGVNEGRKYCLLSKGVSIIGSGAAQTQLVPYGQVASDVDFLQVSPRAGFFNDFMCFSNFSIRPAFPNFDQGHQGARSIWMVFNVSNINVGKLDISRLYLFPGNDRSLVIENNPSLLPQGCPSNSYIHDNVFFEGVRASFIGDSNVFARNSIRSRASGAVGLEAFTVVGALGTAGHNKIVDCNIDAAGGSILLRSGRHWLIDNCNMEQSHGPGTSLGAMIDLRGDIGRLKMPVVRNCVGAIFGTSVAQRVIAITACDGPEIIGGDYDSDSPRGQAIWNRSTSSSMLLHPNVRVTTVWSQRVTDEGLGTRTVATSQGSKI